MFEHTNDEDMGGVHIFLNPKPIYIYIYIKRERERDIYIYIYISPFLSNTCRAISCCCKSSEVPGCEPGFGRQGACPVASMIWEPA